MLNSINPKVSVIIPVFNAGIYITYAIESVLRQTYENYELVVINDGSTDNTEGYILPFLNKIKYIKQQNQGPSAARNNGIRESSGELIAFLDADDIWDCNKLQVQVNFLTITPKIGAVFTGVIRLKDSMQSLNQPEEKIKKGRKEILELLLQERLYPSTLLIKKKVVNKIGLFDESMRWGEDIDFTLKLISSERVMYIPDALTTRRILTNSHSRRINFDRSHLVIIEIYNKFLRSNKRMDIFLNNFVKVAISNYYFNCACGYLRLDYVKAFKYFYNSYYYNVFSYKAPIYMLICIFILISNFLKKREI